MGPFLVLYTALVGFFSFAALYHFVLWWSSRRDRLLIVFSLDCALRAVVSGLLVALASAETPEWASGAVQARYSLTLILLGTWLWCVAQVSGTRARWFVRPVSAVLIVAVLVHVFVAPLNPPVVSVEQITLPWGETIAYQRLGAPGWWFGPISALVGVVTVFGAWCGCRLWARDRTAAVLVVGAAGGQLVLQTVGVLRYYSLVDVPFVGVVPQLLVVCAIGRSIARRNRQTREQLLESKERFRALFEQTFQLIGLLNADGTVIEANRTALEIAGVREADVTGKPLWETNGWTHAPELQTQLRAAVRAAAAGDTVRFEFTRPRPDGGLTHVDFSLKPVRDAAGRVSLLIPEGHDVTERKRVEQELRELNQFNTQVLESTPNGLIVMDREFRYRVWNPQMEEISGLPAAAVLGKRAQDLFPFLEQTGVFEQLKRAMGGERVVSHDFPFAVPGSGAKGWAVQVMAPLRNSRDEIVGVLASVIDISARKQTEAQLVAASRSKEEVLALLDTLQTKAPIGLAFVDADVRFVRCNDALAEMNGAPAADHIGRTVAELVPDLWPQIEPAFRNALSGRVSTVDIEIVGETAARPGQVRIWLVSYYPVKLREEIIGVGVIVSEITDRKRAEDALRTSEARTRAILNAIPDLMVRMNGDGVVLDFYAPDRGDLPVPPDALLGRRVPDVFPGEVARSFREGLRRTFATHQPQVFEYELDLPEKGPSVFEARMVTCNDREVVTIVRNITERRRAEEGRRALEAQLAQAQKMEAVGRLAGGVAHDFNNLLTVINGCCELLQSATAPDGLGVELLSSIHDASRRAAALTRQLLTFSRQQVVAPQVVDLDALVAETETMLHRLIGEDVRLVTVLNSRPARVMADPGQIGQVIMNLVVNARDAMPTGGRLAICTDAVAVDGAARPGAAAGAYVRLAVTDTGCGMTPEVQAHLFEPFFTTKGPGKGTGLGLTTVRTVVEESRGFLNVSSEAGRGTTFELYLPALDAPAPAGPPAEARRPPPRGSETVLLVEDDVSVRSLTRQIMQQFGYTVVEAACGAEAIALVEHRIETIDLLVTDVVMPDMGGRQLVERLTHIRPDLKVLYVSGYTDDAVVRHGVMEADVAFLQKPFTIEALAVKVRQTLDEGARPQA